LAAGNGASYSENFGDFTTGIQRTRIEKRWNPLKDDGDALRLAVRIGIVVDAPRLSAISGSRLSAGHNDWTHGDDDGCCSDEQAVRYAITKVAAEIGKRMA